MSISMASLESLAESKPKQAAIIILRELQRRTETLGLDSLYPDEGPLRRELYVKYLEMFKAGAIHEERGCLGGNRVGKTYGIGGYETALHLTGLYPDWWEGYRFDTKPILAWAGGTKATKVRDVNQKMLCGKITPSRQLEGGLVPQAKIMRYTRKTGIQDSIDQLFIKHVNGWTNVLTFKSYEEGRTSFEAEAVDWIWLDEEPSRGIYDECKMRLLTTRGRILCTLTPVEGMTEFTMGLLEGSEFL